jgi:hypothetical protein
MTSANGKLPINRKLRSIASRIETRIFGPITPIEMDLIRREGFVIFDDEIFSMPELHEYDNLSPTIFPSYSARVPRSEIFCFRNVMCIADHEEIFTKDGRVIRELTTQRKNPLIGKSRRILRKLRSKRYRGKVLHLSLSHLEDNYYHFSVDFLARWYLFQKSGIKVDYIIWPMRTRFQRDFADLLGLSKEALIKADDSLVEADTLVVPALIHNCKKVEFGGFTYHDRVWLPSWIAQAYESVQRAAAAISNAELGPENIYISRKNAKYRKILNESELRHELDKYNFVTLDLDNLSIEEQIQKFLNARVIVSPHGAGLVNMSYSKQPLKILELYSHNYYDSGLRVLANTLGHQYDFLISKNASSCGRNPRKEDIVVDVSKVGRWLKHNL